MNGRTIVCLAILASSFVFASGVATAATLSFSPGIHYVVVGEIGAVPVDTLGVPLTVGLGEAVVGSTFVSISSGDLGVLVVENGGAMIASGSTSTPVQTTALQLGEAILTATFEDMQAQTLVEVVAVLPGVPVPMTAPWLLIVALCVLGWSRIRSMARA